MKKYWKLATAVLITCGFFYLIYIPEYDITDAEHLDYQRQVDSMIAVNYPLIMAEIDSINKVDSLLKLDSLKK